MKGAIQAKKVKGMASEQSRLFFALEVRWRVKVRSHRGEKVQNTFLGVLRT